MIQTVCELFAAAGLAGLVVAVSLVAAVQADDLPTDTNRITSLTSEEAKKLVAVPNSHLNLNSLTSLSPEVAAVLAGFKCRALLLSSLTSLSEAVAETIAEFECEHLVLDGLTSLSPEAAVALEEYAGFIRFPEEVQKDFAAQYPLNPDNARALARVLNGKLSGIAALDSPDSVAVAEALATYKGRLSLPNLKKISPQTLSILIEKEDAIIPLIETLELMPEPDGSTTDDVVIPKGFRERQRRQNFR